MAVEADLPSPDGLPGVPHPREQFSFFGHEEAERAFLDAFRSGKMHHAWLIGGPEGIGKATFAYRAARFLLSHPDAAAADVTAAISLAVDPANPQARKLAAQSHPDVAIVRRGLKRDGKGYMGEISVEVVRKALDLFGSTSGSGGWRICIVDSADDLNAASANALLKAVEEPPPRSLFLIVAHHPARTLTTIRSRCRRLTLRPLAEADVARALATLETGETPEAIARAAHLAQGSVRQALALIDPVSVALVETVQGMLAGLPDLDMQALYGLADLFAKRDAEEAFGMMQDTVLGWISERIAAHAGQGAHRLAPLVEVWEKNARAAREAESYNLDRRPLVISLFSDLAEAVRRDLAA